MQVAIRLPPMFASQPHPLPETWSKSSCGGTFHTDSRHRKRSSGGIAEQWFTSGLPTPPESKAMNGLSVAASYRGTQPTHINTTRYMHNASATASNMQHSLSQSSYDSQGSHTRHGSNTQGYRDDWATSTIASHLQIPESVNKSKGSLAEFAAEVSSVSLRERHT
jgi:hypothetical protein